MGIFHRTDFEGVWNSALFVRNKTFFWYFFLRKPSIMYFYYPFLLDDLCVNHFITRWVAPRSSQKNMKPYQTLKTHSHSSITPIHLPERCSFAPSKKKREPTRISHVQFSSSKWRLVPKMLSSIIITDILTMPLPVFAWRMVPLMLFRARECKITHYRENSRLIGQRMIRPLFI